MIVSSFHDDEKRFDDKKQTRGLTSLFNAKTYDWDEEGRRRLLICHSRWQGWSGDHSVIQVPESLE